MGHVSQYRTGEAMAATRDVGPARRSTLADVAALANVDRSVVSRLVNSDPALRIRESTRQRVLDAIDLLDYRPNAAARSLRTARTRTIGLLIPDFANPVYAEMIKGAERAAARAESLLVTGSLTKPSDGSHTYLDLLGNGRVDGLLLVTKLGREAEKAELARLSIPWLHVNHTSPGRQRQIIMDDPAAARLAVDHLVGLGHRRIAHLTGPASSDNARRRRSAFVAATTRVGPLVLAAPAIASEYSFEGGVAAVQRLADLDPRPTAVVIDSTTEVIGVLHAVRRLGLRVPQDLSIVTTQDLPVAAYVDPPLTAVRMPLQQLGERAFELLMTVDARGRIREVLDVAPELFVRESTAPPPTAG